MKCKERYPRPCVRVNGSKNPANGSLTRLAKPPDGIEETSVFSVTLTAAQGANLTLPPRFSRTDPDSWVVEMKNLPVRFLKDDAGATAIEYGLIAAGISVAIIAVVSGLGSKLNGKFDYISTQLK